MQNKCNISVSTSRPRGCKAGGTLASGDERLLRRPVEAAVLFLVIDSFLPGVTEGTRARRFVALEAVEAGEAVEELLPVSVANFGRIIRNS